MAKEKSDLPPVPESLLRWLVNTFPDKIPEGDVSQRELGVLQGNQEVIRRLRNIYAKQDGPNVLDRRCGRQGRQGRGAG